MNTKVIVSVINDLSTDQRVNRVCSSLSNAGYQVLLVGRKLPSSLPLSERKYKCRRMTLLFKKGPLFYLEYNLRLLLLLLCTRADVLHSNDLDTLPANYLAKKIKGSKLVYDAHEFFTEVPELVSRPKKQRIWLKVEKQMVPNLKNCLTVNRSIAKLYHDRYKINFKVLRNVPFLSEQTKAMAKSNERFFLLQGAGINVDRGAEELVQAMDFVKGAKLKIVGSGDVLPELKKMTKALNLENKIEFVKKVPLEELKKITASAFAGLSLDKGTNLNYLYSLPNKVFDYIHAGIPFIASKLPEISALVNQHPVGLLIDKHEPRSIAAAMNKLVEDDVLYEQLKSNCDFAAKENNWQKEEIVLLELYKTLK